MMNHRPDQQGVWFDYGGCRYKDVYDIRLHTGEVLEFMYPNATSWYPESESNTRQSVTDKEVAQIRLKTDEELIAADSYRMTGPERIQRTLSMFGSAVPPEPQPPSERQVW